MDKRRTMMDEYRLYREQALVTYQEQKSMRLELRGGATPPPPHTHTSLRQNLHLPPSNVFISHYKLYFYLCVCLAGGDTDELDRNVDDWEEETIEFFINEEIIPLGDL